MREKRATPFVDTTLYTNWNAMFISAYLEAASAFGGELGAACRGFALRTIERFLAEEWDASRSFAHRLGGNRLDGSLDDQVFMAGALLDAFEATLDRRYFDAAEHTAELCLEKYADRDGGGFFDRPLDATPLGGLDVRRKPLQDSPTPGGNAVAAMLLDRLYAYTGKNLYHDRARATLETFAGAAPEFGLFAATYGLATLLHARHPLQIVVTGSAGDEVAAQLERRARSYYRFGKAVLRLTPEGPIQNKGALPSALAETLPHLRVDAAAAFVCVGGTCYPPVSDPDTLSELFAQIGRPSGATAG